MAEQKIKFPVFDYQELWILFALFMLGGIYSLFYWHDIEGIIFGILLFSLGAFPMCAFLFHRKYIIRIDSSDYIIFGQEFTENFDIKNRKIPIIDLSYSTYKVTRSIDDSPGNYTLRMVEIMENKQTIIKMEDYDIGEFDSAPNFIQRLAPTWKESLKSTLPELFEDESTPIFPPDSISPGDEAVPLTFKNGMGFVIVIIFGFGIMKVFEYFQ